jgi:hypothetical protein
MKRQVSVQGQRVGVYVQETEPGSWKATGEYAGKIWSVTSTSANRAASNWAVAVGQLTRATS